MLSKIKFWLDCSRWYALPMSIFSWLVIFIYALNEDGNFLYGIITLIGICFAHLATNLFDDYIDFHQLKKQIDKNNKTILPNTQQGKCEYLLNNSTTKKDVLKITILYCFIALIIGLFLWAKSGNGILIFMGLGGIIVLSYPLLSNIRLSELAVGIAYGPLLFGGTYYAMTGQIELEPFILAIPTMLFTINLIYTDTFLDREFDNLEGKKTICTMFKTIFDALEFQKWLIIVGYISIFFIVLLDIVNASILITYLTIPLAIDLINSQNIYIQNKNKIPDKKWFHFPFENWDNFDNKCKTFMFRMYQARNLMIYISILISISILFD